MNGQYDDAKSEEPQDYLPGSFNPLNLNFYWRIVARYQVSIYRSKIEMVRPVHRAIPSVTLLIIVRCTGAEEIGL